MTTAAEVHGACDEIGRRLASFVSDTDNVIDLQWCLEKLANLREDYRRDPASFMPHMDRVKDLSRQVREALICSREQLTAKYLEAAEAVTAWQSIREACREALLELVSQEDTQRLESLAGWIEVKRSRTMSLPKPGTPQREELLEVIAQAELWREMTYPVPARLLKAVDSGQFTPQQSGQVVRLCPPQTVCRLIAHPIR
jgi:hypothetical protein